MFQHSKNVFEPELNPLGAENQTAHGREAEWGE
jgi:hypothetical protein